MAFRFEYKVMSKNIKTGKMNFLDGSENDLNVKSSNYLATDQMNNSRFILKQSKGISNDYIDNVYEPSVSEKDSESKQLLPVKRKRTKIDYSEFGPKKRTRATISHVNTRSVTRKMYNVGATYQAPSELDPIQKKVWPVHGMNERPVWHPKVGLAAEYIGKYYVALENTYHEIIENDYFTFRSRCEKKDSSLVNYRDDYIDIDKKDVQTDRKIRAHNSLHCVLAYCANVASLEAQKLKPKNKKFVLGNNDAYKYNDYLNSKTSKYCLLAQKDVNLENSKQSVSESYESKTISDNADKNQKADQRKNNEISPTKHKLVWKDDMKLINFDDNSISDESLMELTSVYAKFAEHNDTFETRLDGEYTISNSASKNAKTKVGAVNKGLNSYCPGNSSKSKINVEWNSNISLSNNTAIVTIKEPIMKSSKFNENCNEALDLSKVKSKANPIREITGKSNAKRPREEKENKELLSLLQNTALLYCMIVGVHQDDLADYINTLDTQQSLEWLNKYSIM